MTVVDDAHFRRVATQIREGLVIPFLGAGVNLSDRPPGSAWKPGSRFLPNGHELAGHLAARSGFPDKSNSDLLRVSQYFDATLGEASLYRDLRKVFLPRYRSNGVHEFLASLPPLLRAAGVGHQLIITTNYDTTLERAFDAKGESYDLLWYEAKRNELWGRFLHRPPGGKPIAIDRGNKYKGLSRKERTVILKLHGAVQRDRAWDSYVVTENSYIDYLSQGDVSSRIPIKLVEHMRESHFLFLGYSMRDWNLRVILNRIFRSEPLDQISWAVQREPDDPAVAEIERTLWQDRGDVAPVYAPLDEYVQRLRIWTFDGTSPDDA
jgi:hypothetical protein